MPGLSLMEYKKLPELLDEVHALLFESKNNYRFALSGSSARQLKRSQANMLAGRALSKKMFPLSRLEIGKDFKLSEVLCYGQLPLSVTETHCSKQNRVSGCLYRNLFKRRNSAGSSCKKPG